MSTIVQEISLNTGDDILFNNSQCAQKIVQNIGNSARTKFIGIRHHFIRNCVRNKEISFEYPSTENMPADVLTKGLNRI